MVSCRATLRAATLACPAPLTLGTRTLALTFDNGINGAATPEGLAVAYAHEQARLREAGL